MKVFLNEGAFMPKRGHAKDAGFDLKAPYSFSIYPGERKTIDTGVHIDLPIDYIGEIKGKSSIMRKKGVMSNGIVDASYHDSIFVILFNVSKQIADFEVGDTIAQLIIQPCVMVDLEQVHDWVMF